MSLQLERIPVDFQGETYELVCNMAALEDLQEKHGGSLKTVFEAATNTVMSELFEIMLNRARRKRGQQPFTHEEIAESFSYAMLEEMDVFGMFLRAMNADVAKGKQEPGKN